MILCAAIQFHIYKTDKDIIMCGCRHSDILKQMTLLGMDKSDYKEIAQGFITKKGKFLTREQAFIHAVDCEQLSSRILDDIDYGEIVPLCSEDLY